MFPQKATFVGEFVSSRRADVVRETGSYLMMSSGARDAGEYRIALSLLMFALTWLVTHPAVAKPPGDAIDGNRSRTRFVIALEREAGFQVSSLSNPNRVVVDLPDLKVGLPAQPRDGAIGLVSGFRGGLAAPGRLRVVIDVTDPVVVEKAAIEKDTGEGHVSFSRSFRFPPSSRRLPKCCLRRRSAAPVSGLSSRLCRAGRERPRIGPLRPFDRLSYSIPDMVATTAARSATERSRRRSCSHSLLFCEIS
jgi:hypothetical protein